MWQVEQRDWWGTPALPLVTVLLFSLSCFHTPFGAPRQPGRGSCTFPLTIIILFFFLFQTSELSPISLQIQFNHLINPQKTNPPSPSFFNIKDQITPKSNSIIWEYPAFIFLIGPMKTELNKPPKTPPLCLICWCHISLAPSFPNFLFPSFLLFNLGNSTFTVANIIKSVLILHHPLPPLFHILCYCVRAVALSTFCLIMRRTVRWK